MSSRLDTTTIDISEIELDDNFEEVFVKIHNKLSEEIKQDFLSMIYNSDRLSYDDEFITEFINNYNDFLKDSISEYFDKYDLFVSTFIFLIKFINTYRNEKYIYPNSLKLKALYMLLTLRTILKNINYTDLNFLKDLTDNDIIDLLSDRGFTYRDEKIKEFKRTINSKFDKIFESTQVVIQLLIRKNQPNNTTESRETTESKKTTESRKTIRSILGFSNKTKVHPVPTSDTTKKLEELKKLFQESYPTSTDTITDSRQDGGRKNSTSKKVRKLKKYKRI
jgi:hypothetical protein